MSSQLYKLLKIWKKEIKKKMYSFDCTGSWTQHVGSISLTRVEPGPPCWECGISALDHRVLPGICCFLVGSGDPESKDSGGLQLEMLLSCPSSCSDPSSGLQTRRDLGSSIVPGTNRGRWEIWMLGMCVRKVGWCGPGPLTCPRVAGSHTLSLGSSGPQFNFVLIWGTEAQQGSSGEP